MLPSERNAPFGSDPGFGELVTHPVRAMPGLAGHPPYDQAAD
jgi:hypothetical protein